MAGAPSNSNAAPQPRFVATNEQVSCELGGEAVILHTGRGIYFGLNEVGAEIWNLLQQPRAVPEICEAITKSYAVTPQECERDVHELLKQLSEAGLVRQV